MTLRWPLAALAVAVAVAIPGSLLAQGPSVRVAEILEASGQVEISRGAGAPWTLARTGQELIATDAVRTRTPAHAKIKFEAGLQWMLRAASQMELRVALAGAANANTIRVRLESGKAVAMWSPDRASAAKAGSAAPRAIVETPSGNLSALGTEWSVNVEDDGRTALVVLTGSVELSNALGAITVGANEAAEMRVGFAPTLLRIVSPADRVQWVADYAAQPLRYADASIGTARAEFELAAADAAAGRTTLAIERLTRVAETGATSPSVRLALADVLIAAGELDRARGLLEDGRQRHAMDARFDALLARVALFEGRTADSLALATEATVKDPKTVDGWLALGESAQGDGDGPIARQAFQRATVVSPGDARGWFGLGSVETEFEALVPARRWLNRALAIDPKGPGYRGELGTVETLANNFGAANREFAQALSDRRDDYVALTGRALLALKQGREPEALDLLLRATLLEQSYARAQVYLGVTYYRLRRHDDAIRALRKASQLDPKDPLPYLMESAIYTDLYEPWKAMAAGRTANDLMPNLKSLNQLASTQKGTANLGNSVAFFGMEPWAQHLAQESYYPFWAGSHLFLGDRYTNEYARTSEYYGGLLADPTVFGGSPLFQTLLPRAGSYATGDVSISSNANRTKRADVTVSANGYLNQAMPIGYAGSIRGGRGEAGPPAISGTNSPSSGSAAIGMSLSPRWSLFATGAVTSERDRFAQDWGLESPVDLRWLTSGRRFDAGVNFKPSPVSSVSLRLGESNNESNLPIPGIADTVWTMSNPAEVQARYTRLWSPGYQLSGGIELASSHDALDLETVETPGRFEARREMQSAQLYLSSRSSRGRATVQADLFVSRERVDLTDSESDSEALSQEETALRPRVGVSMRMGGSVLRAVYQSWARPWAARSTLAPVATAGIPLDDQLVQPGGVQHRLRAQLDSEWSARTFTTVFAEHQRVENPVDFNRIENFGAFLRPKGEGENQATTTEAATALNGLRDIGRDASRLNVTAHRLLEGDPNVAKGRVSSIGLAVSQVLTSRVSLSTHYHAARSSGTSADGFMVVEESAGKQLSYLPTHTMSIGTTWVSPRRVYFSGEAIHRSARLTRFELVVKGYSLDYVRGLRPADWTARLGGSWESHDKRWAIEFAAADLLAKSYSTSYQVTAKIRR